MKHVLGATLSIGVLFLVSCSKEKSIDTGGNNNNNGGGGGVVINTGALLLRAVSKFSPNDSLGTSYTYDGNRRLSGQKSFFVFGTQKFNSETTITRNSDGVITKLNETSSDGSTTASHEYTVNYDAANKRYTSKVATITVSGATLKDSTAYEYDGLGRVTKERNFVTQPGAGGYVEQSKTEFSYDASGNVIKEKSSDFDPASNNYSDVDETTYEYDTKVNPVQLGNEAFLLGLYQNLSKNNVAKTTYVFYADPTENSQTTFTYTYNSDNKPTKADVLDSRVGVSLPVTYYYQ